VTSDEGAARNDSGQRAYTLLGADRRPYTSIEPGILGGHKRSRIYGQLGCRAALRTIARGGYVAHRVFFANESAAIAAGYRPCSVCLPGEYRAWKNNHQLVDQTRRAGIGGCTHYR
jgi:hypothetical protein